jgi:ribonuclease HI
MAKRNKKRFYAYRTETEQGIVNTWPECESRVRGHKARYRGFVTRGEAEEWLASGARYENKAEKKKKLQQQLPADGVYFDAGTGRGNGTEVRVSERDGTPLTYLAVDRDRITPEGNVLLTGKTNNYGELLACLLAIRIARKMGRDVVLGDSRLVIDYWSRGMIRKETASDPDLRELVDETTRERREFEREGGRVGHISGDINPADLGFHR